MFDAHGKLVCEYESKKSEWFKIINEMREMLLANLVMVSQIPSRTFHEAEKARFVVERLLGSELAEPFTDECGNAIGVIQGSSQRHRILVSAHLDTLFDSSVDHNVVISDTRAKGPGVADNGLGLAVLLTLPDLLQRIGVQFESDIILLGCAKSKERGDLLGIRHFIQNNRETIDVAINLEGITLGQVDHSTLSRVRCDIHCELSFSGEEAWRSVGQVNAIVMLSDILESLYRIPLPAKPKTLLNIGKVSGGSSYSQVSTDASLSLEVRSEDDSITDHLISEIQDICVNIGAKYGVEIAVQFFSRHHAVGLKYSHPLVRTATNVVKTLGVSPIIGSSNSDIAVPLAAGIPAITLGITTGFAGIAEREYIELAPIPLGILQVILLLEAIDQGLCTRSIDTEDERYDNGKRSGSSAGKSSSAVEPE